MDERNSGFAHRIVSEILRLETLVSDLLAYARTDQNQMVQVDVCDAIDHTIALLRHEAEQLHINIVRECQKSLLITGNRDRLCQALLNLGKNAIQAMPDGGSLQITAGVTGKKAIIQIRDDGHGISQDEMSRIFEPFFTTKARGTGLGLALCRKIAEEHGGEIAVQSVVEKGTTVSISIPIRQK
ncbi:MAG: two-component system sensor histidine kinase NtrB [Desulfuromonadaceae bacterium]